MLMAAVALIIAFGFTFQTLFSGRDSFSVLAFLALGYTLTGLVFGPLGSALAKLYPTPVRYTGTSLAFNMGGILGASPAAPIANLLASNYGVAYVGYYLSAVGFVTLIALSLIKAGK